MPSPSKQPSKKKAQSTKPGRQQPRPAPAEDDVRSLAYRIYQARGGEPGPEEEGEDGRGRALGPAAPHHLRRLEALLAEHARLLASLDDVIERGDALLSGSVKQVVGDLRGRAQRQGQ